MKILLICISDRWGGLERTIIRDAVALRGRGHSVAILGSVKGDIYNHARLNNLKYFSVVSRPGYLNLEIYLKLKKIIKENSFDVVHIHEFKSIFPVMLALRSFKGKVFATRHIYVEHVKKDFFHRWYLSRIDKMFGISDFSRQNLIEKYPIDPNRAETLYLGIDLSRLKRSADKAYIFRSKYNIHKEVKIIGVIGRIDPMKGQMEFIESIPAVLQKHGDVFFVIVGQPTSPDEESYLDDLQLRAKELGIQDHVLFTGYFEDVSIPLSAMDILVMPSYFEAFGLIAIEAMACQVMVIATDKGSMGEIISSPMHGIKILPRNSEEISKAVDKLLTDKPLQDMIRHNALTYVTGKFDENVYFNILESKYNDPMGVNPHV
jgi:glycosyltransferase involved in cell wall biosynthesis